MPYLLAKKPSHSGICKESFGSGMPVPMSLECVFLSGNETLLASERIFHVVMKHSEHSGFIHVCYLIKDPGAKNPSTVTYIVKIL